MTAEARYRPNPIPAIGQEKLVGLVQFLEEKGAFPDGALLHHPIADDSPPLPQAALGGVDHVLDDEDIRGGGGDQLGVFVEEQHFVAPPERLLERVDICPVVRRFQVAEDGVIHAGSGVAEPARFRDRIGPRLATGLRCATCFIPMEQLRAVTGGNVNARGAISALRESRGVTARTRARKAKSAIGAGRASFSRCSARKSAQPRKRRIVSKERHAVPETAVAHGQRCTGLEGGAVPGPGVHDEVVVRMLL